MCFSHNFLIIFKDNVDNKNPRTGTREDKNIFVTLRVKDE